MHLRFATPAPQASPVSGAAGANVPSLYGVAFLRAENVRFATPARCPPRCQHRPIPSLRATEEPEQGGGAADRAGCAGLWGAEARAAGHHARCAGGDKSLGAVSD